MLWEVDIYPAVGQIDRAANRVAADARDLGLATGLHLDAAHGYLLQGDLQRSQVERLASELLADSLVERTLIGAPRDPLLVDPPRPGAQLVYVLPKAGVMDPVAQSAKDAMAAAGVAVDIVRTFRKFWIDDLSDEALDRLCSRLLANDAVEQVVIGPLPFERLEFGSQYQFQLNSTPILDLDDDGLKTLSRQGQLYLSLAEMQTIQAHFRDLGREPTDVELETVAQTWSEHCSHKTLAGRIRYSDENGERQFDNMLKETIFAATQQIRRDLGADDWCVSVFKDNAGVIKFDDRYHVVFKVETHNHPSALEPYGGANTGLGGVIRDPLGTGLGAKPICNTDVFCFAPPEWPADQLPPGVLHPKRVMKGVVSGVRDYGNRMGIPTVNGAIYFDDRYLGNPLVYCGNVGLLPVDKTDKEVLAGDLIVAVGGRTGRDGIHGATFSSAELTSESESLSGGAVQIGNAITEKMVLDVIMVARDRGLYRAITDCGAGGFSSAVGEMGADLGAEVHLDRAPVKYDGLTYTEIWISEAQERMVLAVPPEHWQAFHDLCAAEDVEATVLGEFVPTGRLKLLYNGNQVADLTMDFLHDGRPPVIRTADGVPPSPQPLSTAPKLEPAVALEAILGSLNVASKEWVIRQYDHEVQGGSVVKPLVGAKNDGPSDAAVVRPVLSSRQAIVISNGMNPRYGDFDAYHMAASAIDEAIRNCVAVGADPARIAILDNFCWGDCERPETLGSLVRAALACHDLAIALGAPFISGKDSLNNEFRYDDAAGTRTTIAIPPSLLISAIGQMPDAALAVTMDLKQAGNRLYQVGLTREEMGGSHLSLVQGQSGGQVPRVDAAIAKATFAAIHQAISAGLLRACHDLSEGGLAVAVAEMAFAGERGARVNLSAVPSDMDAGSAELDTILMFSESNTRFVCEVAPEHAAQFEAIMAAIPHAFIGEVTAGDTLDMFSAQAPEQNICQCELWQLKTVWQRPLHW